MGGICRRMQIQFTHTLDDLRELHVPEAQAANVRSFLSNRRWKTIAYILMMLGAMAMFVFAGYEGEPSVRLHGDSFFMEILPAGLPAAYLTLLYIVAIAILWKKGTATRPAGHLPVQNHKRRQYLRLMVVIATAAGTVWIMSIKGPVVWNPSRFELILVRGGPCIAVVVLAMALGVIQRQLAARREWETQPLWRRPKTVTLDSTGYTTMDELGSIHIAWGGFARARETENLLVLVSLDGLHYVLPKRAFPDELSVQQCRAMLANALPHVQFLAQPCGFAVLPKPVIPIEATQIN